MGRQRRANLTGAADDLENTLRQHGVHDLEQAQYGERCVLGGLDDDRVAHTQRRRNLPDGDHHRPVPRANSTNYTEWAVVDGGGDVIINRGVIGVLEGGGGIQPRRAGANLEAGVRAVERLTLLTGEQLHERFGIGLHRSRSLGEQLAALFVAKFGKALLRSACALNCSVEVLHGVLRGAANYLTSGGVEDVASVLVRDGVK